MASPDSRTLCAKAGDLLAQGLQRDAKRLYEQAAAAEPDNADAWTMLGAIETGVGDLAAARQHLRRAGELDPGNPVIHLHLAGLARLEGNLQGAISSLEAALALDNNEIRAWKMLGDCRTMLGHLENAAFAYREAVKRVPNATEVQNLLAHTLYQLRRYNEAAEIYRQLTLAQPGRVQHWYLLGSACAATGRVDDAAGAFHKALQLHPGHADSLYGLAYLAYTRHDYPEAVERFRHLLQINPKHAQAHNGLASGLQALGQYREALVHYDTAVKLVPAYVDAHFGRGCTLIVLGDTEGAIRSLRETLRLHPRHAEAHISLASALMTHGKLEEALACCEKALQIYPGHADAVALTATIEQHAGKAEQALLRLQPWLEKGVQNINLAVAYAEVSKTLDQPDAAIELLEGLLRQPQALPVTSQRNLHFNLGRLYDKTGRYEQAFAHYRQGNATRALDYDAADNSREIDAIIEAHTAAFMASAPRAMRHSDKPVFVVGMPRSGTSLVEQILSSHRSVFGAGELPDIWQMVSGLPAVLGSPHAYPRCLPALRQNQADALACQYLDHLSALAPASRRVVDKMPGNFWYLGLIALLFPEAHVIHCLRDPLDTCLSCYFQDFSRSHPYSYDLAQLGRYYRDYRRLMNHWQQVLTIPVLDVHYEALIDNQEAVSRQLVEFIGLDWDANCLKFHDKLRFVATASYDQVRRPLYKGSVGRWRNYQRHLGPLIETLR
jgi:tetratricopeptide (TPR) repeat protein